MPDKIDVDLWIEDFVKKRRISKYEIEIGGNTSKGDGYLGEITFVKVLTGIGQEEEKLYNLVIKSAKKSDEFRKKTPMKEVFEREMFMYSKVFPAFWNFQIERVIQEPFAKFAKCYSVYNEDYREAIILKNLKSLQFDIHDRMRPQNLDHALLVFKNYGKLHALSLAMKKQTPDLFKMLTQNLNDLLYKFFKDMDLLPLIYENFKDAMALLRDVDEKAYENTRHCDLEFVERALRKDNNPVDGLSVILHGDCWNNNMMFSYKGKIQNRPDDMVFLDFQLSYVGSPVYDLSYYLYSVADESLLKYFDLLLQTYHYNLTNFLAELDEHSYDISLEDLKHHWMKYGSFGLTMSPFILKIELSETDEVVDIAECAETGNMGRAFDVQIKNKAAYNERITSVFRHYASLLY